MRNTSKHQHKLIILISTLNYINLNFEQYTQSDILYYFNGNIKRNGQKEVKLKTLQNYLYNLEKTFKVTINYHRHLGINMGTEIHYELKHSKKKCYYIINKHFRNKKQNRHKNRVNDYIKKTSIKNGSVEKGECYYNIYNNKKEEKESIQSIEELQIKKYAKKCNFKSNTFLSITNLKLDKNTAIEILKIIKKTENFFETGKYNNTLIISSNKNKIKNKQQELIKILDEIKISLENEGYNKKQLEIQMHNIYEHYKNKPHFIIENNKYNDLIKIKEKLKRTVEYSKQNVKEDEENIRNNIFSILLEQLRYKVDIQILTPMLKQYLDKQDQLKYTKVFNNHYYYELLILIENEKNYLKSEQFEKITS